MESTIISGLGYWFWIIGSRVESFGLIINFSVEGFGFRIIRFRVEGGLGGGGG